jgi:hypothetical protein
MPMVRPASSQDAALGRCRDDLDLLGDVLNPLYQNIIEVGVYQYLSHRFTSGRWDIQ